MLFRQLERLQDSKKVTHWLVVTSTDRSDHELIEECRKRSVPVFAGSLEDVLDRFYQAALQHKPQCVIRTTGDCPLIDPDILDQLLTFHLQGNYEYSSNALEPTFPDGLDCEVINWEALEQAWQKATLPSEREHVTPYIYKNFQTEPRFKIGNFKGSTDYSSLRWTVDEMQDLELVTKIYEALYFKNKRFRMNDIIHFLEANPIAAQLNSKFKRNEGYIKSLAKDLLGKPKS